MDYKYDMKAAKNLQRGIWENNGYMSNVGIKRLIKQDKAPWK